MKIKMLEQTDNKVTMAVEETNTAFMNSLRRAILTSVPSLAIDHVFFKENNSALFDEVISQRLGQIPIVSETSFKRTQDCDCKGEGCTNCQAAFTLEARGPCMVYSGDLRCPEGIKPLYPNIPIVKLLDLHKIRLEAFARIGTGKEHSKWQVALASYQNYPSVKVNKKSIANVKEIVNICPTNVFEEGKGVPLVKNEVSCTLCNHCLEISQPGEITIEGMDNKFIFMIESYSLPINEIVENACKTITGWCEEVKNFDK